MKKEVMDRTCQTNMSEDCEFLTLLRTLKTYKFNERRSRYKITVLNSFILLKLIPI